MNLLEIIGMLALAFVVVLILAWTVGLIEVEGPDDER